jgi:hypothetical protein
MRLSLPLSNRVVGPAALITCLLVGSALTGCGGGEAMGDRGGGHDGATDRGGQPDGAPDATPDGALDAVGDTGPGDLPLDAPDQPANPDFSLALSMTNLSVAQGQSGQVTLSVMRAGGLSGDIDLSAIMPPAGVTAWITRSPTAWPPPT